MLRVPLIFRLPSRLRRRARRSRLATLATLLLACSLLLLPLYVIYKPPTLLIHYFQHRWPDVLWHVSTSEKVIALTIDDAPSSHTAEILDILKENDATATFFVIGSQIPGRERTLEEIVRQGSELGNHAMHDEPARSLTDNALMGQLGIVQRYIEKAYTAAAAAATNDGPSTEKKASIRSKPPKFFRPGSGFFTDRMRALVARLGYRLVLGSVYPHDPQISAWRVNARHVLSMVRPGAIVICHDRRAWTAPMMRVVLPELRRRGYTVVGVSALLERENKSGGGRPMELGEDKETCGEDSCAA